MRLSATVVAAACVVLAASTPLVPRSTPPGEPRTGATLSPAATEPSATLLVRGAPARDVSWDGPLARPQRLRDLTAQGNVLLVFAPTATQLRALEADRDRLLSLRVVPAAVVERNAAGSVGLARQLGLHFTLIPDPQRVIAEQFNTLDGATLHAMPAWFVLDRRGRVRALDRSGVPESGFARLASGALDLPTPGVALPGSTH